MQCVPRALPSSLLSLFSCRSVKNRFLPGTGPFCFSILHCFQHTSPPDSNPHQNSPSTDFLLEGTSRVLSAFSLSPLLSGGSGVSCHLQLHCTHQLLESYNGKTVPNIIWKKKNNINKFFVCPGCSFLKASKN